MYFEEMKPEGEMTGAEVAAEVLHAAATLRESQDSAAASRIGGQVLEILYHKDESYSQGTAMIALLSVLAVLFEDCERPRILSATAAMIFYSMLQQAREAAEERKDAE